MCNLCVLPGPFRGMGAFYFKIENRGMLNITLLTRIIADKHLQTIGIHFNYLDGNSTHRWVFASKLCLDNKLSILLHFEMFTFCYQP